MSRNYGTFIAVSAVIRDEVCDTRLEILKNWVLVDDRVEFYSLDEYAQYRYFVPNPERIHDYYCIRLCAAYVRELARANNCEGLLNQFGFVLSQGEFDELNSCRYNDLYSDYRHNKDIDALIDKGLLFITDSTPWKPDRKFIITAKGREALDFFHWMELPF